jgi:hypothetical protein
LNFSFNPQIANQISGGCDRAERIFSDSMIASARRKSSRFSPLMSK